MQYPKLVESKTAANKVTHIEWNPGMDLLATVFSNGALTCSRLLSLQKVWQKHPDGKIISIAWRPDGRVLAIAAHDTKTKRYICSLHDVEDGKEIHTIAVEREITSVAWFNCASIHDVVEKEDPIRPKKGAVFVDTVNENFSHQLAHQQTQLNILMISRSEAKVDFYALGLFWLGEINISDDLNICDLHMSNCMRYITATMQDANSSSHSSLKILRFNTFQNRSNEILRVARMYAKITDELEYLEDTFSAIKTSWTDVLAGLDNKLSSYCSRRNRKPDDSGDSYTFISADDLLQLLVIGHPSDNLEKFIADMSDKGLRKLNAAIEQTCQRVQTLIVKNAQKCCYHLHSDLNLLRGMSLWHERFQDVGLDDKSIVKSMQNVGSLMLKLTELQQVIDHSLKSTRSFFRWLISIACRTLGEQNNSIVPNDINKTTQQDVQFITDFILENFDYNTNHDDLASFLSRESDQSSTLNPNQSVRPTCSNFTLEQVGQYLKMEPLTRLKYSFMKSETNFWIDFFKQRPNLAQPQILEEDGSSVLLFYPHNANTSLVQEHHNACESIETAFKSVASNFHNQLKQSEPVLFLRDYARSTSTNRVRIETDIASMSHYTLFQTKLGPTSKQLLMVNNLEDKSFELISLEFQLVPANQSMRQSRLSSSASSNLTIEDSCFYSNEIRDTKKLLLTFLVLDRNSNDTLVIQIELDKLLAGTGGTVSRPHKELAKVFRSNDAIEKHSLQRVLKIDLNTEPASERKHEPEMMVKRIRGVAGMDLFCSSSRGVIAFTSCEGKRLHIYELESVESEPEIVDDEAENEEKIDESLMETDLLG